MAEIEQVEWGIIGAGTIGEELLDQVAQDHVAARLGLSPLPAFVLRSSGLYEPTPNSSSWHEFKASDAGVKQLAESDHNPEVMFIALPSGGESSEVALHATKWAAGKGAHVVTAEKGMLTDYWKDAKEATDDFDLLGMRATVGGGNRLIQQAGEYLQDPDNVMEAHFVLNGTLTYMLSEMSKGDAIGTVAEQAVKLGYAEPLPKNASPTDVIRSEAQGDIPRKTSILLNAALFADNPVDWREFNFALTNDQLKRTLAEVGKRRFVVSLYNEAAGQEPEDDIIGGFTARHDGWLIIGGFRNVAKDTNPMFAQFADYNGTANGGKIALGPNMVDGVYPIGGGPGAGPKPTVNAMLDDSLARSV